MRKVKVTYFQRKPRPGFNFSLEQIFEDIRQRLGNKIDSTVIISPKYNDGYYSKLINILSAWKYESDGINHVTGEVHFLDLLMKKSRVVLTVLDCGMISRKRKMAKQVVKRLYFTWPVRRASYVTAISEFTKQEIIRYTNCPADKIVVIPVAVDPMYRPSPRAFNKERPNILHIGTGYNKNLPRLTQALEGIECTLTIIGKLTGEQKQELEIRNISYENKYNLSQQEIYQRYIACDILAFVSTFEGFGMPIVEANAVERSVITSNLSSMPEVAGKAACLVNPFEVSEIREGILRLMNDDDYREQLIQNGRENKLRFDADTIAQSYYELYRKMQPAN